MLKKAMTRRPTASNCGGILKREIRAAECDLRLGTFKNKHRVGPNAGTHREYCNWPGNDTLNGGPDSDFCKGGLGTDTANNCEDVSGVP